MAKWSGIWDRTDLSRGQKEQAVQAARFQLPIVRNEVVIEKKKPRNKSNRLTRQIAKELARRGMVQHAD